MTMNEAIALANIVLGGFLIALGILFLVQARTRRSLWGWPPSALVALGVVPLLTGVLFIQIAAFRLWDAAYPFEQNEWGTLVMRIIAAISVAALFHRVYNGKLLTDRDRTRIVREDST